MRLSPFGLHPPPPFEPPVHQTRHTTLHRQSFQPPPPPQNERGAPRARLPPTVARRAQHPNQCPGHRSRCFTPKHSLLQPRLHHPCRLGGPHVGRRAASPLPFRGSLARGQAMGERGGQLGESRGNFARCARCANVLPLEPLLPTWLWDAEATIRTKSSWVPLPWASFTVTDRVP